MLQAATSKLSAIQEALREVNNKKESVEAELALNSAKLERAKLVLAGLGWDQHGCSMFANEREGPSATLVGDVLTAAAVVAYLGPFSAAYR